MSSADLITCSCNACNALLCVSTNNWTEVTSSYATYDVSHMFSHPGLEQSGQLRPGSKESELEGCTVQSLHCVQCKESVGVKCTNVVPEKEAHRDRCFLKLGRLSMKDLTGRSVEANIKVRGAPRPDANSSALVDNAKGETQKISDADKSRTAARRSISTGTEDEEDGSQNGAMQLIKRQEADIVVILQSLETLQREMKNFQKEIHKEMKSVKTAVDDIRARQEEQQTHELTEDIELLTETVSTVSGKVGELDSLKLEIKMMQSRVKRLEDEKRGLHTGIEPPATPRSISYGGRPAQSYRKAEDNPLGDNMLSRRNTYTPAVNSALPRSQTASVQGSYTPRSHSRSLMPPPGIPHSAPSRKPTVFRSASETTRNPNGRNSLHNAVSTLNESASEFPSAPQDDDDDDEYHDEESSPDPQDDTYQPRRSRQSLPSRLGSVDTAPEGHYNANSTKRRRTTSHAIDRDNNTPPSPHPDDPAYKSLWAAPPAQSERGTPAPVQRNEHGLLIKHNGQIDKRSLRFLGKVKNKRRSVAKDAVRDAEGYLLEPDGTRNERSVRIIDGMRKREMEEREMSVES